MNIGPSIVGTREKGMEDESPDSRPLGPRNLPRASHACQRCREKKGRCNQQQPCSSCIRVDAVCVYGEKRKKRRRIGDAREEILEQDDTRLEITPRPWPLTGARSNSVQDAAEDPPGGNSRMDMSPEVNINSVRSGMSLFRLTCESVI